MRPGTLVAALCIFWHVLAAERPSVDRMPSRMSSASCCGADWVQSGLSGPIAPTITSNSKCSLERGFEAGLNMMRLRGGKRDISSTGKRETFSKASRSDEKIHRGTLSKADISKRLVRAYVFAPPFEIAIVKRAWANNEWGAVALLQSWWDKALPHWLFSVRVCMAWHAHAHTYSNEWTWWQQA